MIKDIQKKIGVVFQFNIHKKGMPTKTWILDGKSEKPVCYPGKLVRFLNVYLKLIIT